MSSKKSKTKVSQADLRKMMQQMKNKKAELKTHNGSSQNNVYSATLKRTAPQTFAWNELSQKKAKTNMDSAITTSSSSNFQTSAQTVKTQHKQLKNPSTKCVSMTQGNSQSLSSSSRLQKVKPSAAKKMSSTTPLVSGVYSDSDSSSDDEKNINISSGPMKKEPDNHETKKSTAENSLPAGFFDDPETDAKMRGVETPADKMDREWESFQKELQHETGQSEQLIDEEQENVHLDREIDQIDEQIQFYHLVTELCVKKDDILHKLKHQSTSNAVSDTEKTEKSTTSDSDEDDIILDWREKDAFI